MTLFWESRYVETQVEWKVEAGEVYKMKIVPQETEGMVSTVLTIPELMPLNELQNTTINGQDAAGQPVMGIAYYGLPVSGKTLLLLVCGFGGACAALILCAVELCILHKK